MVTEVMAWVTEQWCHAFPMEPAEPPVVVEVVVPNVCVEQVVAEAEVLCAAEAVVVAAFAGMEG